jgi:hypothetical protein
MNLLFLIAVILLVLGLSIAPVPADDKGNTHIDLPLVHVHANKTQVGGRHQVTVRAPFVHVDNPPGPNNASVKAPFTHVQH